MGGSESNQLTVTTPSDREIVMTRVFDAPRDLVFEAHTSCEHMSHWWGPRRYEIGSCEIDFRPGGKWRIVHRSPDGGPEHVREAQDRDAHVGVLLGEVGDGRLGLDDVALDPRPRRVRAPHRLGEEGGVVLLGAVVVGR